MKTLIPLACVAALLLSQNLLAQGGCSSCAANVKVKFMMEEDINGSFSVTLNGVTSSGSGSDSAVTSSSSWATAELEECVPYDVTVDVGIDGDEATNKGDDRARVLFDCKAPCGLVFEVFSGFPGSEYWREIKDAVVYSDQGHDVWGFGVGGEGPATGNIRVRLRRTAGGDGGGNSATDDAGSSEPEVSNASVSDPENDVPAGANDDPDGVDAPTFKHSVGMGEAPRYSGSQRERVSAGYFRLSGAVGLSGLADRSNLVYNTLADTVAPSPVVRITYSTGGEISQVETGSRLAIVADEASGFSIKIYEAGEYQEIGTSGVFEPVSGGTAFTTCKYEPVAASSGNHIGGVRITTTANGTTSAREIVATTLGGNSWRMTLRDSQDVALEVKEASSVFSAVNDGGDWKWQRTDVVTVERDGVTFSKVEEDWLYESWGDALMSRREYAASAVYEETTYSYFDDDSKASYGKLESVTYPDGGWESYTYYDYGDVQGVGRAPGMMKSKSGPWKNSAYGPGDVTTQYSYAPDPDSDSSYFSTKMGKSEKFIGTGLAGKRVHVHALGSTTTDTFSDSSFHMTSSRSWAVSGTQWDGLPSRQLFNNGMVEEYSYDMVSFRNGSYSSDSQGDFTEAITKKGFPGPGGVLVPVANQSTGTRMITDSKGRTVLEEMLVYNGSSWEVASTSSWTYEATHGDNHDNKVTLNRDGEDLSIVEEVSSLETHSTDQAGWKTITTRDVLGRVSSVKRVGRNGQADITTAYTYSGRDVTVVVTGGALARTTSMDYDWLGRVVSSDDENGLTTSYAYSVAAGGGRVTTVTRPDGQTEVTRYYRDGQIKSVTGTGVVERHYDYSFAVGSGEVTTTERIGSATSPRYTETARDFVGRTVSVSKPAYTGIWTQTMVYDNDFGRLLKITTTGTADQLFEYDSLGVQTRRGLDIDADGRLLESSSDPITETVSDFVYENGSWMRRAVSSQWQTDGNGGKTQLQASKTKMNSAFGYSESIDVYGDGTTSSVSIDGGVVTTTTDLPHSDTDVVVTSAGRRTLTESSPTNGSVRSYAYDDIGRVTSVTGTLGDVTEITYYGSSTRQDTVTPPTGPAQKYLYVAEGTSGAGQVSDVITLDRDSGAELSRVTYTYDARGNRISETGTGTYPKEFVYDPAYPEMTGLKTFRDHSTGTPELTTWVYQEKTGLLTRKEYADTNGTDYEYHDSGRLHKRIWARGITTTTTYDSQGMPDTVTYSDGTTTGIDYDYSRAGRLVQVTDAAGTHTISYGNDGQPTSDAISGTGVLSGYTVAHGFTEGHGLRSSVTVTDASTTIAANTFSYEPTTGRLQSASQGGFTSTYTYRTHTDWVASIVHNDGTADLFTQRTHRDLGGRTVGVISRNGSAVGGNILARVGYKYDPKGRREHLIREDGTRWEYGYNTRDELTEGSKRQTAAGALLAGRQFEYDYDDIGNRKTASYGGDSTGANLRTITYTAGTTNRYSRIAHPGYKQILGYSTNSGAIRVSSNHPGSTLSSVGSPDVQGDYWSAEVLNATTNGFWEDLEIEQDDHGGPQSIGSGNLWFEPSSVSPSYDADGNLTSDGRWDYTWNGENRLIKMEVAGAAQTAGHPWMRLSFQYDYLGRRIEKKVETGSSGAPVVDLERIFVYDGWNMIAEIDTKAGTPATHATYLWGHDLSGSGQGAGGVGGLLLAAADTDGDADVDGTDRVHFPSYDGNGNIIAWVDEGASVVVRTDFSPFGEVLAQQGSLEELNYGFSTKYTDRETGLCYYGYRYYDPVTGRWLNRDPEGEDGGLNLYGFVENNAINLFDPFGLKSWKDRDPLNIAMRGAQLFGQGFDGAAIIDAGADASFRSRGSGQAKRHIEKYFDINGDGKLDEKDCPPFKLNMTGYSWGAWSVLEIAHGYHRSHKDKFEIRMGLVDPVSTLRSSRTCLEWRWTGVPGKNRKRKCVKWSAPIASKPENVVYGVNYYQTMGGAGNPADGLFVGSSVPGMDINTELGEAHGLREGFAHVDIMQTPQARAVQGQIFK